MKTWPNIDALLSDVQNMSFPQHLDLDYDGSCPCFALIAGIGEDMLVVEGSCWRVGDSSEYQDLRVGGTLSREELLRVAEVFKSVLDKQAWYNPYRILLEG